MEAKKGEGETAWIVTRCSQSTGLEVSWEKVMEGTQKQERQVFLLFETRTVLHQTEVESYTMLIVIPHQQISSQITYLVA